MPETDRWLVEYGERHADIRLPGVYWVCVVTLVLGTVGMLWSLPVPAEFERISPVLNWGSAFLMAAVVYYFIISMPLAIGMLPFVVGVAVAETRILESPYPLSRVSAALFAASVFGLWLGHRGRGGLRDVFQDIQMMMIAPAWLLSVLYRRFGIPY